MATLLRADGTREEVQPRSKNWTLKEWQKIVGGYVQHAPTIDDRIIIANEDGLPLGLPPNHAATGLYKYNVYSGIVGDVLIITKAEFRRATT